jgi:hypothetical protein
MKESSGASDIRHRGINLRGHSSQGTLPQERGTMADTRDEVSDNPLPLLFNERKRGVYHKDVYAVRRDKDVRHTLGGGDVGGAEGHIGHASSPHSLTCSAS